LGLVSWVWLWPLSAGFEATCLDAAAQSLSYNKHNDNASEAV